jgi:hypothetical protein
MGARVSDGVDTTLTTESPAGIKIDQSPEDDRRILECLGAAVIMRWDNLPTKIQRELFEHAASLADLGQTAMPKGQIARFLHDHKHDYYQRPLRVVL